MHRRRILELLSSSLIAGIPGRAARQDRVVIAGAGIIGASIAYHLAKRGARVTVLEKARPGAGATEKSFAWINAGFAKQPRAYFELNLLGVMGWRRLSLEFPDLKMQWGGSVRWVPSAREAEELRGQVRSHENWGYAAHMIEPEEITRLMPGIDPGAAAAACFCDQEGTLDPVHGLNTYLAHAKQAGATVEYPCELTGISVSGGRVRGVQTTRGAMEADFLVLAAGTDTERLAAMVEVKVPLKESSGLLAHTAPFPRVLERVAFAPGANIKQNPDGRIVTGIDFKDSKDHDTGRESGLRLLAKAEPFLRKLKDAQLETVTLGYRVLPKDDYPIVGFVQRAPNLYIAALHSGMTMSPIIGQAAAAEILDGVTLDILAPYRPGRFA
jgi:glycine/D-amino acid oxidase-like deaminating enzyme